MRPTVARSLMFARRALRSKVIRPSTSRNFNNKKNQLFRRALGTASMDTPEQPSFIEFTSSEFRGVRFSKEETQEIKKGFTEGDNYKRALVDPKLQNASNNEFVLQIIHRHVYAIEGLTTPPTGESLAYKVYFEEETSGDSVLKKIEYHSRLADITGTLEPLRAVEGDIESILSWRILGKFGEMTCPEWIGTKFDKNQTKKIKGGFMPRSMDDHWAIGYDEDEKVLHFIRSWTGAVRFRMYFEEDSSDRQTLRMTKIDRFRPRPLTNSLEEKERVFVDDAEQRKVLNHIFKWLILGLRE